MSAALVILSSVALAADVPEPRPRIFLRPQLIGPLRQRCLRDPDIRKLYTRIKREAEKENPRLSNSSSILALQLASACVVYMVEHRSPEILARVKHLFFACAEKAIDPPEQAVALRSCSMAFDWCPPDLSEDERAAWSAVVRKLAEDLYAAYRHCDYNNRLYGTHGQLVFAGLALLGERAHDEFARKCLDDFQKLLKYHMLPATNQVGSNGAWHEGPGYAAFLAKDFAPELECWRIATGEDLFPQSRFLRNLAPSSLMLMPRPGRDYVPVCDVRRGLGWMPFYESTYLPLLVGRYGDGFAQAVQNLLAGGSGALTFRGASSTATTFEWYHLWPTVLWSDPSVKPRRPQALPLARLWPGPGWCMTRTGYGRKDTFAFFKCGDYFNSHQHWDENSFMIHRTYPLAVDPARKLKETRYHNTLLIGGEQRIHGMDERSRMGPTNPGGRFDRGDIIAYRNEPAFTYVVGDASNAYDGEVVERFVREFLFVRPEVFVVLDRVRTKEDTEVSWLLHTMLPVSIDGKRATFGELPRLISQTLLPSDAQLSMEEQEKALYCVRATCKAKEGEDLFILHVLRASDPRWPDPPRVTLKEDGDTIGVSVVVERPARWIEMQFARDGIGGKLIVREGRKKKFEGNVGLGLFLPRSQEPTPPLEIVKRPRFGGPLAIDGMKEPRDIFYARKPCQRPDMLPALADRCSVLLQENDSPILRFVRGEARYLQLAHMLQSRRWRRLDWNGTEYLAVLQAHGKEMLEDLRAGRQAQKPRTAFEARRALHRALYLFFDSPREERKAFEGLANRFPWVVRRDPEEAWKTVETLLCERLGQGGRLAKAYLDKCPDEAPERLRALADPLFKAKKEHELCAAVYGLLAEHGADATREHALFRRAESLKRAGNDRGALAGYKALLQEFPSGANTDSATRRVQSLSRRLGLAREPATK